MVKKLFVLLFLSFGSFAAATGGDPLQQAVSYAEKDEPEQALKAYRAALATSNDPAVQRRALFGIGRMQLWLEEYKEAEATYCRLLKGSLSPCDRKLAVAGLVDALALSDRPIAAYLIARRYPPLGLPSVKAALWGDHPFAARRYLCSVGTLSPKDQKIIPELMRDSSLYRFTPEVSAERDSGDEGIFRGGFKLTRAWGDQTKVDLSARGALFTKPGHSLGSIKTGLKLHSEIITGFRTAIGADYVRYGGWQLVEPEFSLSLKRSDFWAAKAIFNNKAVENTKAVDRGIRCSTGSLELTFISSAFTFIVEPTVTQFSNHNVRDQLLLKAVIPCGCGFSVEPRVVYYRNSNPKATGYFNPHTFNQEQIGLRWKKKVAGDAKAYILVAGGLRNNDSGTFMGEAGISGPLLPCLLANAHIGYSNTGFNKSYTYQRAYAALTLDYFFN